MSREYPPVFSVVGAPFFEERAGLVLVGFIVRSGDVIDAITPLYRLLTEGGGLSQALFRGAKVGGAGGVERVALLEGCAISSLRYQAATYFGHASLLSLQLGFRRFSHGELSGEERGLEVFSPQAKHQTTVHEEVALSGQGRGFIGVYGEASLYVNRLGLVAQEPAQQEPASVEGLTQLTLAELYQSAAQSAAAAHHAAQEEASAEAAKEALHQADLQRTTSRLRLWLHKGALSVEGATSLFLRGWDTGASEERLRLLAPGSLLRVTFSCQAERSPLVLRLRHLSFELGGGAGHSPVTITLNKQAVIKDVSPPHDYYTTERFELSAHRQAGENTLEITLGEATSQYWLESLELLS